jgi:uncharacterized protein YndB with AHSA1/START domain
MDQPLKKTYIIHASPTRVWEALTNPDLIKEYFFGTNVISEWKEGSEVSWTGEWKGKPYLDKGVILKMVPEKLLTFTHWSSRIGVPDKPSNYSWYSYELELQGPNTALTITQENKSGGPVTEKTWEHWDTVVKGLKNLLEKQEA